jgi:hypothetical protein
MRIRRESGLKRLGQGLGALFSGSSARADEEARKKALLKTMRPCMRCRKRIRKDANRCPHCGAKLASFTPNAARPSMAAAKVASGGQGLETLRKEAELRDQAGQLSFLERKILLAVHFSEQPVHVMRPHGSTEGEIKAGAERIFGNDAVLAIDGMLSRGWVEPFGDLAFQLTGDGRRVASLITA